MATSSKFGSAFAEARKAGLKTFEHEGKKYTTQTKEEARPRSAGAATNDRIVAKKAADMPGRMATEARAARAQSTADTTRASRLNAQAAERRTVEAARVKQATTRESVGQSDAITARKSAETARTKGQQDMANISADFKSRYKAK